MKHFIDGVKTPCNGLVKTREVSTRNGKKEFTYLPWARGLALADHPCISVKMYEHGTQPYMEVFGGAVVAVDQALPDDTIQSTYLPVLNGANQPRPVDKIDSRDIGDAISRCRAKSVAMVNGVGLSLYAHGMTSAVEFIKRLKVAPDSNLHKVEPLVCKSDEKNGEYIDWSSALAAARITDPNFHWEVAEYDTVNTRTGEIVKFPAMRAGTGWCVAVKTRYKGKEHTEILPMMGFMEVETKRGKKMLDHRPLINPNVHDWNRSVMRCLTKAIAFITGYGLNVYAREDDLSALDVAPLQRKEAVSENATPTAEQEPRAATPARGVQSPDMSPEDRQAYVTAIQEALDASGKSKESLLLWLGCKDGDLSSLRSEQLVRASQALKVEPMAPANVL